MQNHTFQKFQQHMEIIWIHVYILNKFILSNYPENHLYKQGQPYDLRKEQVESGYKGFLKMTMVEELVHSTQDNLQEETKMQP